MLDTTGAIWQQDATQQFAVALTSISDVQAMQNFLRDVMTQKEITEMSARLEAARQLQRGETYTDIVASTKLSSRTVARISEWMKNGCGGYAEILRGNNDA
ncbi:MAG TPA: YerC/YecD family TrpR-related protein [Candidatus Saccharimonadales bacterium]